jgi:hypothetical protein
VYISRRISEVIISIACLATVIMALVGIDPRVRDRFWQAFSTASSGDVTPVTDQLHAINDSILQLAQEHSISQAPLLLFTVVALVLVMFMLRT